MFYQLSTVTGSRGRMWRRRYVDLFPLTSSGTTTSLQHGGVLQGHRTTRGRPGVCGARGAGRRRCRHVQVTWPRNYFRSAARRKTRRPGRAEWRRYEPTDVITSWRHRQPTASSAAAGAGRRVMTQSTGRRRKRRRFRGGASVTWPEVNWRRGRCARSPLRCCRGSASWTSQPVPTLRTALLAEMYEYANVVPRDAALSRCMLSSCVCPSVCPSYRRKPARAGLKCVDPLGRIIIRGSYPPSNAIIYMHLQL